MNQRYALARGTQVREEDFGLLFYQMNGPRLHFVASGGLLGEEFFRGDVTLAAWLDKLNVPPDRRPQEAAAVARALAQLIRKGVIVEC